MYPLVLLLLAGSPKDCGSDPHCVIEAGQSCGPLTYRYTREESLPDFTPTLTLTLKSTYELRPRPDGGCWLDRRDQIVAVAPEPPASVSLADLNASPLMRESAVAEPALAVEAMTGSSSSAVRWYPSSCPAPTKHVAKGCSWSACGDGPPTLRCGAKTCRLPALLDPPTCTARGRRGHCPLPMLLSGKLSCTARCAANGKPVDLRCK